jgi:hypothetical protein
LLPRLRRVLVLASARCMVYMSALVGIRMRREVVIIADIFLTCITWGWAPLCNSCCDRACAQPIQAIDVDELITPEQRKRFAFALANMGVQRLHVAPVPRGGAAHPHQLRMDDCQVVYEGSIYQFCK